MMVTVRCMLLLQIRETKRTEETVFEKFHSDVVTRYILIESDVHSRVIVYSVVKSQIRDTAPCSFSETCWQTECPLRCVHSVAVLI